MSELARFPVEQIRVVSAGFGGSIHYNPIANLAPCLWYGFGVDLAPIELGDAAAHDRERTLRTSLSFGGIVLPQRRWTDISGVYGPIPDVGDGSIYLSSVHNPIDIRRVSFRRLEGVRFAVNVELLIAFECGGSGFEDAVVSLEFEADYGGVSFYVPEWTNPDQIRFPPEWRIPAAFDDDSVREIFSRFIDLDCNHFRSNGRSYSLEPMV